MGDKSKQIIVKDEQKVRKRISKKDRKEAVMRLKNKIIAVENHKDDLEYIDKNLK